MAMVGLFWVSEDAVHLGAPPGESAPGVRLATEGLDAVGPRPGTWKWADLGSVTVVGAPVRTAPGRQLSMTLDVVLGAMGLGGPEGPAEMTVRVQASDGAADLLVHSAAAGAYTPGEVELSHQVLDRFVAGTLSPAVLSAWGRTHGTGKTPRPAEREALLQQWAQS
ncbi:hypothetical protein [Streptomyces sp. NRRL B-24720]|uniref:hypothetical protein n=1 Tax=Streptomyces sp. NRRL B-24720 TaxID=1476876 RepID=UPI0004C8CEA6|nr:hypothetical protein [Streptomyces sp. NRRL B-24720]